MSIFLKEEEKANRDKSKRPTKPEEKIRRLKEFSKTTGTNWKG